MSDYESYETELELKVPNDDETVVYRVWYDFNYTDGQPAKLWAAPEDCYPEEYPEVEITRIQFEITDGVWCDLNKEHYHLYSDKLEAKALEALECSQENI